LRIFRIKETIFALVSLTVLACTHPSEETHIKSLEPVKVDEYAGELSEYEGAILSSISDFTENSIAGVQKITENTYKLKITGLVNAPLDMTYSEVLNHERFKKVVTLECVDGWQVNILSHSSSLPNPERVIPGSSGLPRLKCQEQIPA
jgi:hypothetical protein